MQLTEPWVEQMFMEANIMIRPRSGHSDGQGQGGRLKGKVALIVADTLNSIHTLAVALAERGAEVTVVGPSEDRTAAAGIQEGVEDWGRRFLFIPEPVGALNPDRVVRQVLDVFGHLDIYIDFSRSATPIPGLASARDMSEIVGEQLFTNPDLVTAAMRTMARK